MKKIALILAILYISANFLHAERIFPYTIFSNWCGEYEYEIDKTTKLDSIVKEIDSILPLDNISLYFKNVDEKTIDSLIYSVKRKRFINEITFNYCNFKKMPLSVRKLINLTSLHFIRCDSLISLNGFNTTNTLFVVTLESCRIKELPEGLDKIYSFLFLMLDFPNDFTGFDLNKELEKFSDRKNILNLFVKYKLLDKFPESLFKLTNLQSLMFFTDSKLYFPPRFDELKNLVEVRTSNDNQRVIESFYQGKYFIMGGFNIHSLFDEEDPDPEAGKYCLISGQRSTFRYKVEIDTNTIQGFAFFYIKDNAYPDSRMTYKLNENEIIFHIDTIQDNVKLEITKLKDSDSVKVFIAEYKTEIPLYSYEYKKGGIILDFKDLKKFQYNFIVQINEKRFILNLILVDNGKRIK